MDEDTWSLSSVPGTHWCKKRTPSCLLHAGAQTQINYFWKKSFELFQFSNHFIHAHNISLFRTSPIPILPPQSSPPTHTSFHVLYDPELPQAWVRTYWNKSNLAAAVSLRKGLHNPPSTTILCQQALVGGLKGALAAQWTLAGLQIDCRVGERNDYITCRR